MLLGLRNIWKANVSPPYPSIHPSIHRLAAPKSPPQPDKFAFPAEIDRCRRRRRRWRRRWKSPISVREPGTPRGGRAKNRLGELVSVTQFVKDWRDDWRSSVLRYLQLLISPFLNKLTLSAALWKLDLHCQPGCYRGDRGPFRRAALRRAIRSNRSCPGPAVVGRWPRRCVIYLTSLLESDS